MATDVSKILHLALRYFELFRLHLANFSAFSAIQVASYLIPIVTIPYFTRVLTISGMGQIAIANAAGLAGGVLMDYGVLQSGTRFAANNSANPEALNRYLIVSSTLKAALFCGLLIVLAIAGIFIPLVRDHIWVYLWALLSAAASCFFPLWLFQGLMIIPTAAKILVTTRVLAALAALALIRSSDDTFVVPMTQALGSFISLLAAGLFFHRSLSIISSYAKLAEIRLLLRDNWNLFSATTWGIVHTYGSIIIIGIMLPANMVGFYSIAERISQAFVSLFNIGAQTIFPTMVRRLARSDDGFARTVRLYLLVVASSSAVVLALIFFARVEIYSFFVKQESREGISVFSIWIFASFFTVICVSLSPVMIAMRRDSKLANVYRFTGLTFLVLAPLLVYFYGVVGMAIAALYPQFFMGLYFLMTVNRELKSATVADVART